MNTSEIIERKIDKTVSAGTGIAMGGAMEFANVAQIMEFAKVMAVAQVAVPKHLRDNPGACLAMCIQASEWQMSPFAVANKSYVVNDRLAFEAQLINAVILRRAPIKGRFKVEYSGSGEQRTCKVMTTLIDGETVTYESPPLSRIPTKNSPLWKGDPDQQLFYYSSRAMCRRHFPDVLLGVYTVDELQAEQMRDVSGTATARTVPLDPFNEQPKLAEEAAPVAAQESEPADVLAEPVVPEGDKLTNFMLDVDAIEMPSHLNEALAQVASFETPSHAAMANSKVFARAGELGFKFNERTGRFAK